MELANVAKALFKISKSVRFVTVSDRSGKVLFSAHPRSVRSKLSKQESRSSLSAAAKMWKVRRQLTRKLGPCRYVVAEYAKVKRITMPVGKNNMLFVTTSASFDHNKVIRRVRKMR